MEDKNLESMFQSLSDEVKNNKVLTDSIIERVHPKISFTKVLFTFAVLLVCSLLLNKLAFLGMKSIAPESLSVISSYYKEPEVFGAVSTLSLIEDLSNGMLLLSVGISLIVCLVFPEIVAISSPQSKEG